MIESELWILKKTLERKMSSGHFGLLEMSRGREDWFDLHERRKFSKRRRKINTASQFLSSAPNKSLRGVQEFLYWQGDETMSGRCARLDA